MGYKSYINIEWLLLVKNGRVKGFLLHSSSKVIHNKKDYKEEEKIFSSRK